ncbi:Y+L amino acid transporter 2 isoform X2 [Adelges cooleyi]|nr:Y+L amino acid transporter 2 isoform X2 [Adelges cooleyi]XP_050443492.1 Y+L amino acid transporter 2 isoform X2 [Adelges cooleyi]XP_050443493.1 Y+L amino acid transporter 2 isoform X2 [Adelges cooleyi]
MSGPTETVVKNTDGPPVDKDDRVRLKKQLGLLEGCAIILGIIFGSGIFISPSGVMSEVGSVGLSLSMWVLCGLLSMIGALCYAELGTSIPRSGGDYTYLFEGYGPLPAFLYLWDAMLVFVPTTNAIMGLTFANYVIKPFFPDCENPDSAVRLLAAAVICLITFVNCWNVKATTKVQNVFMFTKIAALVLIIVFGGVYLYSNGFHRFENPWQGSITDPGRLAVSVYSGIYSYSGWNYLNFMTEELRNPYVNLPRAIYISMPLVTIIYVLANVAYLSVLSPKDMASTNAIAVTFGHLAMGSFEWVMPLMVALSAFGGLCVHIMTSSRMCFVGARYGHFPTFLSYININRFTPTPSLVFLNILSLLMLFTSDVNMLITYSSIVESFFTMLSVSSVLWSRWKNPDINRPIKVALWIPILYVLVSLFLILLPCYVKPKEVGMGVAITLSGIPVYYLCVVWQTKPVWFQNSLKNVTFFIQKLFVSAKEDKAEEDIWE